MNKKQLEKEIWKLAKRLNELLYEHDGTVPQLSLEVVEYLQKGGD